MKITPVEFNGGEHYRSARISLDCELNEQMSAQVLMAGMDQPTKAWRDGGQVFLRTVSLALLKTLEETEDPNRMFRPALVSPKGMRFCVYQALDGVLASMCYLDPTSGRLMGVAPIPDGRFLVNNLAR